MRLIALEPRRPRLAALSGVGALWSDCCLLKHSVNGRQTGGLRETAADVRAIEALLIPSWPRVLCNARKLSGSTAEKVSFPPRATAVVCPDLTP